MPNVIPAPLPPASLTVPGVVTVGTQFFGGPKAVVMPTAGASDIAFAIGANPPLASIPWGFKALQVLTNTGGTVEEIMSVKPDGSGTVYTGGVLNFAQPPSEKCAIDIAAGGVGHSGMISWGGWNGGTAIGLYHYSQLKAETTNRGIQLYALASAYLGAGIPHIRLISSSAGARTQIQIDGNQATGSDTILKVGTTVADASTGSVRLLSLVTGIDGTEKEWARFERPTGYGGATLRLKNPANQVNTYQLALDGCLGVGGLISYGSSNLGFVELHGGQASSYLAATNRGLLISQNSNSYDSSTLMRFNIANAGSVAATVPAFDFECSTVLQTNQKLMRWKVNSVEVLSVDKDGKMVGSDANAWLRLDAAVGSAIEYLGNRVAAAGTQCVAVGNAADGASAVAFSVYSANSWSNAGAKLFSVYNASTEVLKINTRGTIGTGAATIPDASGTPGNATQNTPRGRAAMANGTAAVTITNDQVDANSVAVIEWEADPGQRHWVTYAAGSFTVNVSANVAADKIFKYVVFK